jgi:hypothetical protein
MDQIDPVADHPHLRASPSLREWGSLLLVAVLTTWVVYSPGSGNLKWEQVLHNTGHGPIFGLVATLLLIAARTHRSFRHWSLGAQCISAIFAAASLGLAAEGLQFFTHRDPSWEDATNDAVGAIAFVCTFALYELTFINAKHTRIKRTALAIIVVATLGFLLAPGFTAARAYIERNLAFPVVADFTDGTASYFVEADDSDLESVRLPSTLALRPNERALEVRFGSAPHSGIALLEPRKDWRGYRNLVLDIANPSVEPLDLALRVHDQWHRNKYVDRFNRILTLDPSSRREIRIPLSDIERGPRYRLLDLSRVTGIILSGRPTSAPERMYVQRIWLE